MSIFINIDNLFNDNKYPIYAHTSNHKEKQPELLSEHIEKCQKYYNMINEAKELSKVVNRYIKIKLGDLSDQFTEIVMEMFCQAITFHDVGKRTPEFQRKKMNNSEAPKATLISGLAKHATISSLIYLDYYYGKINDLEIDLDEKQNTIKFLKNTALLNAYVISRHHSDLNSLFDYVQDVNKGNDSDVLKILQEDGLDGYRASHFKKNRIYNDSMNFDIEDYLYCRFVYSILVSCDYYATAEYCNDIYKYNFGNLEEITELQADYEATDLMKCIRKFEKDEFESLDIKCAEDINQLRSTMFLEVEKQYEKNKDSNVYFLKAPTGSGKTNMAINLGLCMMKEKKKLFYIYPFNTLVEQTMNTLKQMLNEESLKNFTVVNSLMPIGKTNETYEDEQEYYQKALLDRQFLNYPCILSTNVSFFDLLFGNNKGSVLGFYQLCDSVIVLDEIQSYKNSIWTEIMLFLNACSRLLNMQIIIMSATLPDLTLLTGDECGTATQLVVNPKKYYDNHIFKDRVRISYELLQEENFDLEMLKSHIKVNQIKDKYVLVEFLYKKTAEAFYRLLLNEHDLDINVCLITGDDSLYEREKILEPIKNRTLDNVILVSTQVVEAGVDIDMDIGYKNISKLDSEEQFLGRINRSCRKKGIAYFFNYDKANIIYRDDYRIDDSLTLLEEDMKKLLDEKAFDKYYEKVLEMLGYRNRSTSEQGLKQFYDENVKPLDFVKIAEHMRLIDKKNGMRSIFLNRAIEIENGEVLEGKDVWDKYRNLLMDNSMSFAEKKVKLSHIRLPLSYFIYEVNANIDVLPNDIIGELWFIENGEDYFKNGKINREKLMGKDSVTFL